MSISKLQLALLASAVVFGACATPDSGPTRPTAKRVVLAPVNFDSLTPAQLEPGLDETDRLLQLFLHHRGLAVERVPLGRFRSLWKEATGGKSLDPDSPEYGAAIARVLSEVAPDDPGCVLVLPGILYRMGDLRGTRARWDGLSERVIVEGLPTDWGNAQFNERTRGVSVWIRVFDPSGRRIHEGHGGVELPWKIIGGTKENMYGYNIADRDDLFENASKIARGITIAFHPYIPRHTP